MYINKDELRQSGIIPYRLSDRGLEVLLVTSNTRKRWIIPKGNIEPHLSALESARKEAFEEAGVKGRIRSVPFGRYSHETAALHTTVEVFVMEVKFVLERWPEGHLREREWFPLAMAYERVLESGLKQLLRELEEELS